MVHLLVAAALRSILAQPPFALALLTRTLRVRPLQLDFLSWLTHLCVRAADLKSSLDLP